MFKPTDYYNITENSPPVICLDTSFANHARDFRILQNTDLKFQRYGGDILCQYNFNVHRPLQIYSFLEKSLLISSIEIQGEDISLSMNLDSTLAFQKPTWKSDSESVLSPPIIYTSNSKFKNHNDCLLDLLDYWIETVLRLTTHDE